MTATGPELQAVILTAGFGRRMRPLSDRAHKALLPIGETTILGRIMDALGQLTIFNSGGYWVWSSGVW
jgi:NDP-sugar pyrophosphorylase family protein